jgi:predicted RNA binding protein YcfA (HicA-like mRNA interferase family)
VRRRLLAASFVEVGQSGSHVKFARRVPGGIRTAVVPHHREIALGTLRSILRQAGLTAEQFDRL